MMSIVVFFECFFELNIVIIGDVMIDCYLEGKVNCIFLEVLVLVVYL